MLLIGLETFLVEWKRIKSYCAKTEVVTLKPS